MTLNISGSIEDIFENEALIDLGGFFILEYLIFLSIFITKNPLEFNGASFSKISLLEPEIFKFKEWFQVKVPIPFRFRSSLIAVYGTSIKHNVKYLYELCCQI